MPSKLCPHYLGNTADLRRFVEAGAPLVKLAGVFGPAPELLALNPDLLVVGRVVEAEDLGALADSGQTAAEAARALVDRQRDQYMSNPAITIWEGPNEPVFGPASDPAAMRRMAWYAAFEAERLRLLADLGLRGVVGNFSTGAPDLPLWAAFLPALDAAEQRQGFLGLHEYSSPFMWSLSGRAQLANCDADTGADEGDTGWTTLRYRKVYRQHLAPNGLASLRLIITECGLDRIGAVCPGQSDGSWRVHGDYWASYDGARDPIEYWRGPERDPERYYAEQLLWYDRELEKDPFVVGAALFTVGTTEQWRGFDVAGTRVVDALIAHLQARRPVSAPGRPAVTPPEPARAAPPVTQTIRVPPGPEPASAPARTPVNLLINAGFEEGQAYFADATRERAVPSGWLLEWAGPGEARQSGQSLAFGLPITALINSRAVVAEERGRIFAEGVYCWKVCGPRAPFRVRLWQALAGLEPGRPHRFAVNVLPDVWVQTGPPARYAAEPLASEVRLAVDVGGERADTGWLTGAEMPYGRYHRLTLDFIPVEGRAVVAVEVGSRFPLPAAAWYIDELSVTPL